MIRKIRQYIAEHNLLNPETDRLLLAVSGGPDSVAMADIIHRLGFRFAICHVNFQLRGSDSDGDEIFVRQLAQKYGAEIFVLRADTHRYAREKALSIEMAAREIRYAYFSQIMDQHGCTLTAVAHHQDDAIETLMLNLVRGAGIRGLTGIPNRNGRIIRPLLCLSRSEIESYLRSRGLGYRTDKTNLETDFARNKIRNLIIPVLEQINPSARASISESLQYLASARNIYNHQIQRAIEQCAPGISDTGATISIPSLMDFQEPECLLFEIASRYGFHKKQCASILKTVGGESGRTFSSRTHRLIKDRRTIIIEPLVSVSADDQKTIIPLSADTQSIATAHHTITIESIGPGGFHPGRDPYVLYLSAGKLAEAGISSAEITPWTHGDVMVKFGGQRKKVSDILIDKKLSIIDKEKVEVLRAGGKIIWIPGIQTGNHYKVEPGETEILKITAKKK